MNAFVDARVGNWSLFEHYRVKGGKKLAVNVETGTVVDSGKDVVTVEMHRDLT